MSATQVQSIIESHSKTLRELNFEDVSLVSGTWDEALSPLNRMTRNGRYKTYNEEIGDVPIMFYQPKTPVAPKARSSLQRCDSAVHFASEPDTRVPKIKATGVQSTSPDVVFGRKVGPTRRVEQGYDRARGAELGKTKTLPKLAEPRSKKVGTWREEVRRAIKGGLLHWR